MDCPIASAVTSADRQAFKITCRRVTQLCTHVVGIVKIIIVDNSSAVVICVQVD